ncbi:MAG: HlyD family efflux transporter periplasmic adaptor subunit [Myxococcota bacterium]
MNRERELQLYSFTAPSRVPASHVHPLVRWLTRALWIFALVSVVGLLIAPWQQSVTGAGRAIAFAPTDRTQNIEAPIKGRITKWYVAEGSQVQAGDPIADITDNDPNYLSRLQQQERAATARVEAAQTAVAINEARVSALQSARDAAVANAQLYVQISRDKLAAAKEDLDAAEAAYKTAQLNHERQTTLGREGLVSTRKVELADLKLAETRTKRQAARAKANAARREVAAATAKLDNVSNKEASTINKAEEELQKLRSDQAKADQELAKAQSAFSRQEQMKVVAPTSGTVLRLVANGPGHFVKEGDQLAQIVPNTASRAVELWVSGNDAPLITAGRKVRVQFEGWPAVQFVGWPSVAVGTFGAEVAFVDATDDGTGKFRIVVVPDPEDDPWPEARFLRQGVRANGWVLLNEVTVAFELWRQLNGFPPVIEAPGTPGDMPTMNKKGAGVGGKGEKK